MKKLNLLYHTVKHLKPIQVLYQLKYRLKKSGTLQKYYLDEIPEDDIYKLKFEMMPPVYQSYLGDGVFVFLNLQAEFGSSVNWAYEAHGKLWNYNLQYANWLLQEDMEIEDKLRYLKSMYDWLEDGRLALEPYPVSLRTMNVMRLFSAVDGLGVSVLQKTHAELNYLSERPEYHLLGNHLLENAFALMMGGAFFGNKKWIDQGQRILLKELDEQILSDGAHFELSPMYHQIMFFRLLELIDWYGKWEKKKFVFEEFLHSKASEMLSWLNNISFRDGTIPHFNDSAEGIAYGTDWLSDYAYRLTVIPAKRSLGQSGYRSVEKGGYECKIDFAQIGAKYQAGHGHADALSFILYHKGKPLFVEHGTSTYQDSEIRYMERATSSHNTVVVNGENQSKVWSAFRVAQRAVTTITKDNEDELTAYHDGYKKYGIKHERSFMFHEDEIVIADVAPGNKEVKKEFHLHVAPDFEVKIVEGNNVLVGDEVSINFDGANGIVVEKYSMANGYNKYKNANKIVVTFAGVLRTKIKLK